MIGFFIIIVIFLIYYFSPNLILRKIPQYRDLENALNDLNSQYLLTKDALTKYKALYSNSEQNNELLTKTTGALKNQLTLESKRLAECSANVAKYIKNLQLAAQNNIACKTALNRANAKLKTANELLVNNFNYVDKEMITLLNVLRENLSTLVTKKITLANDVYTGRTLGRILNTISDDLELTTRNLGICKHYNKENVKLDIAKTFNRMLNLHNTENSLLSLISSSGRTYYVINNNSRYYNLILNIENIISYILADKLCKEDGLVDVAALKELTTSIQKHLQDSTHLLKHSQGIFDVAVAGIMSIIPGVIKPKLFQPITIL